MAEDHVRLNFEKGSESKTYDLQYFKMYQVEDGKIGEIGL